MTSLLSSIARQISGEYSRSYSGRSSSIQSVPSFNDFNSGTHIEEFDDKEALPVADSKYTRHSVDIGQLYSCKPAEGEAVSSEAPVTFGASTRAGSQPWDIPGKRGLGSTNSPSKRFTERKIDPGNGRKMDMYEYCELIRSL